MPIKSPPLKATPSLTCDWIELKILSQPTKRFSLSKIKRIWDVNRETEDTDPEGLEFRELNTDDQGVNGEDADRYLDSVLEEIADRAEALGAAYPFEFEENGIVLRLRSKLNEGCYIYLFCLFISNCKIGDILDGSWLPPTDHVVRDLFQACSTLAAAGELEGCAISFGWPRPNKNPPFLKRLQEVYQQFGEGTVRTKPLPGISPSPKDEEIDIIAWKPRRDRCAGTLYMLGQVASGDNWKAKSVKGVPIDNFHRNWFAPSPPSTPTPAIFIPHAIGPNQTGNRREVMELHAATYGVVFDRIRLPVFAQKGIELAKDGQAGLIIERVEDVQKIVAWVDSNLTSLLQASN